MMRMRFVVLATLLSVTPGSGWASEESGFWDRDHLSGSWGGARSRLEGSGVFPFASLATGVLVNARGGHKRGSRYLGLATWGLDCDLATSVGWTGGRFHIQWNSYHGGNPTGDLVGGSATQDVSNMEAERSIRFYTIYLQQTLFSDALTLKAGQLAMDEDFFASRVSQNFVNSAFGEFTILAVREIAPVYPLAAPGVFARWQPADVAFFFQTGLYAGNVGSDKKGNFGFDWSLGRGIEGAAFVEAGVDVSLFGRPGTMSLGAGGATAEQPKYESDRKVHGLHFFHAMLEQTLLGAAETGNELAFFVRGAFTPLDDRTLTEWLIDGGVTWQLARLNRPQDIVGLAFAYHHFSADFVRHRRRGGEPTRRGQTVLELTYRAKLAGWLELQPNLQWVIDPWDGGRDAWVVGAQARIEL